jgi:hypothetical protein
LHLETVNKSKTWSDVTLLFVLLFRNWRMNSSRKVKKRTEKDSSSPLPLSPSKIILRKVSTWQLWTSMMYYKYLMLTCIFLMVTELNSNLFF